MIREFFDKAHANLSAAQLCFENDLLDAAANRATMRRFKRRSRLWQVKASKKINWTINGFKPNSARN